MRFAWVFSREKSSVARKGAPLCEKGRVNRVRVRLSFFSFYSCVCARSCAPSFSFFPRFFKEVSFLLPPFVPSSVPFRSARASVARSRLVLAGTEALAFSPGALTSGIGARQSPNIAAGMTTVKTRRPLLDHKTNDVLSGSVRHLTTPTRSEDATGACPHAAKTRRGLARPP